MQREQKWGAGIGCKTLCLHGCVRRSAHQNSVLLPAADAGALRQNVAAKEEVLRLGGVPLRRCYEGLLVELQHEALFHLRMDTEDG